MSRGGRGWIGAPVSRLEDARLLTGRAQFVDDVEPAGTLHAAFVRADVPAGRLVRLQVERARAHSGVAAVFTASDLGALCRPGPVLVPPPPIEGSVFHARTALPLARDRVRHQGEALALIVAESRYVAEDAAALVEVDIDPTEPMVEFERALDPDAPRVHDDLPLQPRRPRAPDEGELRRRSGPRRPVGAPPPARRPRHRRRHREPRRRRRLGRPRRQPPRVGHDPGPDPGARGGGLRARPLRVAGAGGGALRGRRLRSQDHVSTPRRSSSRGPRCASAGR